MEVQPVDEDDAVIVPAPPASAFLPYRSPTAAAAKTSPTRLSLRRTLIPILLTCGIILLVLGTMPFFLSEENPLSQLPHWMSYSLWALGMFLLALGVVNMLAVKHLLEAQAAAGVAGPR